MEEGETFCIFVKLLSGKVIPLTVNSLDSIWDIKLKIQDKEGFPPSDQRLIYSGKELQNDRTLLVLEIMKESIINCIVPLQKLTQRNVPSRQEPKQPDLPQIVSVPVLQEPNFFAKFVYFSCNLVLSPLSRWFSFFGSHLLSPIGSCLSSFNNSLLFPFCEHFIYPPINLLSRGLTQCLISSSNASVTVINWTYSHFLSPFFDISSRTIHWSVERLLISPIEWFVKKSGPLITWVSSKISHVAQSSWSHFYDIFSWSSCKFGRFLRFLGSSFVDILSWIIKNLVAPVIRGIGRFLRFLATSSLDITSWILKNLVSPVIRGFGRFIRFLATSSFDGVSWIFKNLFFPLFRGVGRLLRFVSTSSFDFLSWIVHNLVTPVIRGIGRFLRFLCTSSFDLVSWIFENLVTPVIRVVARGFKWVFDLVWGISKTVLTQFGRGVARIFHLGMKILIKFDQNLADPFFQFLFKWIGRGITNLSKIISAVWRMVSYLFRPLGRFLGWSSDQIWNILFRCILMFKPMFLLLKNTWKWTLFRLVSGVTSSSGFVLGIRPGKIVEIKGHHMWVLLNDSQQYAIYLYNPLNIICFCKITIDEKAMGIFKLDPKSHFLIERPMNEEGRFTFIRDPDAHRVEIGVLPKKGFGKGTVTATFHYSNQPYRRRRRHHKASAGFSSYSKLDDSLAVDDDDDESDDSFVSGSTTLSGVSHQFQFLSRSHVGDAALTLSATLVGKK